MSAASDIGRYTGDAASSDGHHPANLCLPVENCSYIVPGGPNSGPPRDRCDDYAGSRANGVELIGRLQNDGCHASSPVQSKGRRRMKIVVGRYRAAPVMTAVLKTREANSKLQI